MVSASQSFDCGRSSSIIYFDCISLIIYFDNYISCCVFRNRYCNDCIFTNINCIHFNFNRGFTFVYCEVSGSVISNVVVITSIINANGFIAISQVFNFECYPAVFNFFIIFHTIYLNGHIACSIFRDADNNSFLVSYFNVFNSYINRSFKFRNCCISSSVCCSVVFVT